MNFQIQDNFKMLVVNAEPNAKLFNTYWLTPDGTKVMIKQRYLI